MPRASANQLPPRAGHGSGLERLGHLLFIPAAVGTVHCPRPKPDTGTQRDTGHTTETVTEEPKKNKKNFQALRNRKVNRLFLWTTTILGRDRHQLTL